MPCWPWATPTTTSSVVSAASSTSAWPNWAASACWSGSIARVTLPHRQGSGCRRCWPSSGVISRRWRCLCPSQRPRASANNSRCPPGCWKTACSTARAPTRKPGKSCSTWPTVASAIRLAMPSACGRATVRRWWTSCSRRPVWMAGVWSASRARPTCRWPLPWASTWKSPGSPRPYWKPLPCTVATRSCRTCSKRRTKQRSRNGYGASN
ncbi:hypothetical protein D3C80_1294400 [compost metagenome]